MKDDTLLRLIKGAADDDEDNGVNNSSFCCSQVLHLERHLVLPL